MKKSEQLLQTISGAMKQWPIVDISKPAIFARNLVFMHRVILASESLLEAAVQCSRGELREYFVTHLEEERRHDEWMAADLASVGIQVENEEFPAEAVYAAGAQYYLINHVDPCALLGYMAALECFPMPIEMLEEMERVHGKALCRTLRHHAEHDSAHGADLLAQVDKLDEKQFSLVMQNAANTALYIGSAITKFEVQ